MILRILRLLVVGLRKLEHAQVDCPKYQEIIRHEISASTFEEKLLVIFLVTSFCVSSALEIRVVPMPASSENSTRLWR